MQINITAIILAAGQSTRMGRSKMLLPWGHTTVLGSVIMGMRLAGVTRIIVVTGSNREKVEDLAISLGAQTIFNQAYKSGEMLSSLQCGLQSLFSSIKNIDMAGEAAMICLGDQPRIQKDVVHSIIDRHNRNPEDLIVPSFHMRRGHPWLVPGKYWDEILRLIDPQTLRDFLNNHSSEINYVEVEDGSVVSDLDTWEDYLQTKP